MALSSEWRQRIEGWLKELPRHFLTPLEVVELEGAVTAEQLTVAQAENLAFTPMPAGTEWGGKWEYAWFRFNVTVPAEAAGRRLVVRFGTRTEGLVFVDGQATCSRSDLRPYATIARHAEAGRRYQVLAEFYAGHGVRCCKGGPTPVGVETVPEPPATQDTLTVTVVGLWQEDVYQSWLDASTLFKLRDNLDPDLLRVAEIDAGLRDFTVIADLELPEPEMCESLLAARERLRPLLGCTNGSTAPVMYGFGHAHLDVAWLWPLAETERKAARTLANQLQLAEEFPAYVFLHSQPHLFRMVKERYPRLWQRVKKAVADGRILTEGGSWVEADTNISGGEALIRQFIHGKRFVRDEFGQDCEILWLPDVFGYSGALPQILRGCGIRYFATAKIFWNYHGGERFPHNTFTWEGIDGSEVRVHLMNDYNAMPDPAALIERWRERVQRDGISTRLFPFGYGDGGGGPTRDHLEYALRAADLEGAPRFKLATPNAFFADQEARGWPDVRYVGELYFQAHRGTYTSQARTKRGNRQCEMALREAEMWGVAARALGGMDFAPTTLDAPWKTVLLNQFHDILPGSSIGRVYEEAEAAYAGVLTQAGDLIARATDALTDDGDALTVFNSLGWARTALAPLPAAWTGAADDAGDALPTQVVEGVRYARVELPPCGWSVIRPAEAEAEAGKDDAGNSLTDASLVLENELLRVQLNERGEVVGIHDKESAHELTAGTCNVLRMFKDVPANYDAWDIDSTYEKAPVELPERAEITVVANGPLLKSVRVTRQLNASTCTQEICLRAGSRRLDFITRVDWQESHKLLKVAFPVAVHANEALHDIQFGHLARPNHRSRQYDADRFEVCNHKWTALVEGGRGAAVLNDCKYGVNVLGNCINLTLLKSALAPDMNADKGCHEFTYSFYSWNQPFALCDLVREAYEINVFPASAAGAAAPRTLLQVSAGNIVVESVKPAEDGSADIVVRLYEAAHAATRTELRTTLPVTAIEQTDMLEENGTPVSLDDGCVMLQFRPFEVKTLRLRR